MKPEVTAQPSHRIGCKPMLSTDRPVAAGFTWNRAYALAVFNGSLPHWLLGITSWREDNPQGQDASTQNS